tara:strand:+ start:75 stop:392 length:318 start_codon:yes stop_codon:yes gene_type:complete
MKESIETLILECKQEQEWKKRWKANHIELDDYFKYSGKIEPDKILITRYVFNHNNRCNDLHEKFIKKQDYEKIWEKNKSHSGRFAAEVEAHCWNETENSVWSDKI